MPTVEELYQKYETLISSGEDIILHENVYADILSTTKNGTSAEKRLASQFINKFYKHFPDLMDDALNAQFDLCEDNDHMIRKQAIKSLPPMCKESRETISQVANVLSQLLQSDDKQDIVLIFSSLLVLRDIDFKSTLTGIFMTMLEDNVTDNVREKSLKFLEDRFLKNVPSTIIDNKVQEFMVEKFHKVFDKAINSMVLAEVNRDEFIIVINIMVDLPIMKTLTGRTKMIDMICEQAEMEYPFDVKNYECVDRILQCTKAAIPLFSKNVSAKKFISYLLTMALPKIFLNEAEILTLKNSKMISDNLEESIEEVYLDQVKTSDPRILELLKTICEMMEYSFDMEDTTSEIASTLITILEAYLPETPEDKNVIPSLSSSVDISLVECFLFILHEILKNVPKDDKEEIIKRLKNINEKFIYLLKCTNWYAKQVSMGKVEGSEKPIKEIASNIGSLVKDFSVGNLACRTNVNLSFIKKSKNIKRKSLNDKSVGNSKKAKDLYVSPGLKSSNGTGSEFPVRKNISRIVF